MKTRRAGVHRGTFEMSDEALDVPPRALALARARREAGISEAEFLVLRLGETRLFSN